jgi:hypothetical protein
MEQKFKKILQITKAWQEGREPLSKTFEGALFESTSWPFSFEEGITTEVRTEAVKVTEAPIVAAEKPLPKKVPGTFFGKQVMFVGDTYLTQSGKEDLLGKMIGAMKLNSSEFVRLSFNEALDEIIDLEKNLKEPTLETYELYKSIIENKPEIVVSLGATITNILLGRREKLSSIHGQFVDKTITVDSISHTFTLMPLFHPDFLVINPNMKRTAWIDLQKVMERVGKI